MSPVMDLAKRFEEGTAYTSVYLSFLEINILYPISISNGAPLNMTDSVVINMRL